LLEHFGGQIGGGGVFVLELGYVSVAARRADYDLEYCEEEFQSLEKSLGPQHQRTLESKRKLADAYIEAQMDDKAIPVLEGLILVSGELISSRSLDLLFEAYLRSYNPGGRNYDTRSGKLTTEKRPDKAIELLERTLPKMRLEFGGAIPPYAAYKLEYFARQLLEHDEYEASEPILRECLAIRSHAEPNAWTTFETKSKLGFSLLRQGKPVEAEPLLKEGYEGLKAREKQMLGQGLPRLTEALERLVQLYDATGNAAEADRYRKELAARKAAQKQLKK